MNKLFKRITAVISAAAVMASCAGISASADGGLSWDYITNDEYMPLDPNGDFSFIDSHQDVLLGMMYTPAEDCVITGFDSKFSDFSYMSIEIYEDVTSTPYYGEYLTYIDGYSTDSLDIGWDAVPLKKGHKYGIVISGASYYIGDDSYSNIMCKKETPAKGTWFIKNGQREDEDGYVDEYWEDMNAYGLTPDFALVTVSKKYPGVEAPLDLTAKLSKCYDNTGYKSLKYGIDGPVDLSWTASAGAVSYNIYRRDTYMGSSGDFKLVAQTKSTSYKDTNVLVGHIYTYAVQAVSKTETSYPSMRAVNIHGALAKPTFASWDLNETYTDASNNVYTIKFDNYDYSSNNRYCLIEKTEYNIGTSNYRYYTSVTNLYSNSENIRVYAGARKTIWAIIYDPSNGWYSCLSKPLTLEGPEKVTGKFSKITSIKATNDKVFVYVDLPENYDSENVEVNARQLSDSNTYSTTGNKELSLELYEKTDGKCVFVDNHPVPGKTFEYRATIWIGRTGYLSNKVSATIPTAKVTAPKVTSVRSCDDPSDEDTFGDLVTWNAVSGAKSYDVYYYPKNVGEREQTTPQYCGSTTDTKFLFHQQYNYVEHRDYFVIAVTDAGRSVPSNLYYRLCRNTSNWNSVPEIISAEAVSEGLKLTWVAGNNCYTKKFAIFRGTDWDSPAVYVDHADFESDSVDGTYSYIDTTFPGGQDVYYFVEATDDYMSGGFKVTTPAAPVSLRASGDAGSVRLEWTATSNATKYRVRRNSGKAWETIATTANTYYVDNTAVVGASSEYVVIPYINGVFNTKYQSEKVSFGVEPSKPELTIISNDEYHSAILRWTAAGGASKYRVRRNSGSGWTTLATVAETAYVDTVPAVGKSEYVVIPYISGKFDTAYQSDVAKSTIGMSTVDITVSVGQNKADISWTETYGATRYRLRRNDGTGWTSLITTTDTSYTDTALASGKRYTYVVYPLFGKVAGEPSNTIKIATVGKSGSATVSAMSTGNWAEISWKAVSGAKKYRIRRNDGTGWQTMASTANLSWVDSTMERGKAYTYVVYVSTDGKTYSNPSSTLTIKL